MAYYETYMPDETGELQKVVINAGVGFVLPYYGETAPPGTLACDGSEISREAYKELFAVLGTKAGAGDGSTTFNLPDLRGEFIRGWDAGRGVDAGRTLGSWQAGTRITGDVGDAVDPSVQSPYNLNHIDADPVADGYTGTCYNRATNAEDLGYTYWRIVRPRNIALLWCIIYE